ncbi:bile acid-transporting ATPase [Martiniozyma asiatica (nom. inval.)]|nr:bile acid-transporting ATPase [Martiniozyma asiatica]
MSNQTSFAWWNFDDFTSHGRHHYLEQLIPTLLIAHSFGLILIHLFNKCVLKHNSQSVQLTVNEETPLITDNDLMESRNSETSISEKHFDIRYINPVTEDDKPLGTTKTVFRGFRERTLLAFQFILFSGAVAASALPFFVDGYQSEWQSMKSPIVHLAFWSYLFILTTIRVCFSATGIPFSIPNLWYHTFILLISYCCISFFLFRSVLLGHILSNNAKNYYIFEFFTLLILIIIQGSDQFSDRPVQLYFQEGIEPSPEPTSGFFQVFSFSWLEKMIYKARKVPITMNDIWSLTLEDNSYFCLLTFHKDKWHNSFSVNLFWQFRKLFLQQSIMTSLEAVTTFFPSMLLKKILEYVESPDTESSSLAWLFVILMFFCSPVNAALSGRGLFLGRRICTRMRAILIGEVYSKALRRRLTETDKQTDKNEENESNEPQVEKEEANRDMGSIINLVAVDSFKVSEICAYLHYFLNSFVMTVIAIAILYSLLGWASLAGTVTIILMMPLNYKLSMMLGDYQKKMLKVTDKRIQKLNETFQSIRIIKYFAWENKFAEQILAIREEELAILVKRCLIWVFASFVWFITPTSVCLVAFYCYTVIEGKPLTTPIAFTSLSLFNLLRTPLDQFADMLSFVVQSKVSLDRISSFLDEPESSKYEQLALQKDENSPDVGFQNATFSWSNGGKGDFMLRDLDIAFKKGKLNVVIGPTGSGKSSLLLALLGEMNIQSGKVFLPGSTPRDDLLVDSKTGLTESVAYCAQTAWLLNGSIKENILFASRFDEGRYKAVVDACGLKRDFEILAAGDQTEIGEKGITLSGGQKQRVSLARALYSNAAYVLLDDCLSAVDSHTSVHIYEQCITGKLMKNRTCILVSHNITLTIKEADYVVAMENGRVKCQGPVENLLKENAFDEETASSVIQSRTVSSANLAAMNDNSTNGPHADLLSKTFANIAADTKADLIELTPNEEDTKIDTSGKLVEEETKSEGSVSWIVYKTYFNMFGNKFIWFSLFAVFIAAQAVIIVQSWWLRVWSLAENEKAGITTAAIQSLPKFTSWKLFGDFTTNYLNTIEWHKPIGNKFVSFDVSKMSALHSSMYYIAIYSLIGLVYSCLGSVRIILTYYGGVNVSRKMFKTLLIRVLRGEVRFFDSTPIGRIMNRFSKDIEGIDQELAPYAEALIMSAMSCLSTILLITFITPAFLLFGIFMSLAFGYVGVLYLTLARDLKRFEAISRSPINQHFTETLVGVTTIRAYGDERRFLVQNMSKIDSNNRPFFYVWANNRWMSFRAQFVGYFLIVVSSTLAVLYAREIDAGLAGISLSFAATFSTSALWLLRAYADVEININAVERIQEYIDDIKQEPAAVSPQDPSESWPNNGEIEVKNLSLRYASHLPQVINGISFHVKAGEKVGVVGRTGAGKSTIITSFFRFIEPDTGKIVIDGVDIGKIGLDRLRNGLTIIPQEPTLFAGTVRSNLDIFHEYGDLEMYESLRCVGLISDDEMAAIKVKIQAGLSLTIEGNNEENINKFLDLDCEVSESGNNLSQGERQLVCLARSLLKHPKILMLDEATASIDYETDAKIQNTIREEFSGSTILTIAHRLKTIIDYDKILVLENGNVKEYDHPWKLLNDPNGTFYSMCQDTGEFNELKKIAKDAWVKGFGDSLVAESIVEEAENSSRAKEIGQKQAIADAQQELLKDDSAVKYTQQQEAETKTNIDTELNELDETTAEPESSEVTPDPVGTSTESPKTNNTKKNKNKKKKKKKGKNH